MIYLQHLIPIQLIVQQSGKLSLVCFLCFLKFQQSLQLFNQTNIQFNFVYAYCMPFYKQLDISEFSMAYANLFTPILDLSKFNLIEQSASFICLVFSLFISIV